MSVWIIESHVNGTSFWSGDHIPHEDQEEWTKDLSLAVRFCRKADAEMVIVGVLGLRLPSKNVFAQEAVEG